MQSVLLFVDKLIISAYDIKMKKKDKNQVQNKDNHLEF